MRNVVFRPRLYISGPMTGLQDDNYPAFNSAAAALRAEGWQVVNPAEHFGGAHGLARRRYLAADVVALMGCKAIVLLHGWEWSEGSLLEVQIGLDLGFQFFSWHPRRGLMPVRTATIEEVLA